MDAETPTPKRPDAEALAPADLAAILFPHIRKTQGDYEAMYAPRGLPPEAIVTRFAPSPTGFMHIGGLFTALVAERLAHQSGGVFLLRIEDTDKKREVAGGLESILEALRAYGIPYDEGVAVTGESFGAYGPYFQSERAAVYQAFARELVARGLAYPCFCAEEELAALRARQEAGKLKPGYYGAFATCRALCGEDIRAKIDAQLPCSIRLRSPGSPNGEVCYHDLIKGRIAFPENEQDVVLIKSGGLPTYHFAHAVDDYLMRTTHVIRGDEWVSSVPVHLQLFEVIGARPPVYAHLAPIMKLEGASKRKLSKRKDPEAAVEFYREQGFPPAAVLDYLMTLANSDFEDWRRAHADRPYTEYELRIERYGSAGALFDLKKIDSISKGVIAAMPTAEVYERLLAWARQYDPAFAARLTTHEAMVRQVLEIDKGKRQDFARWSQAQEAIAYFFEDLFGSLAYEWPTNVAAEDARAVLAGVREAFDARDSKEVWWAKLTDAAESLRFAKDKKAFKQNPTQYRGSITEFTAVVRMALTRRANTPDLYAIMQILGKERVRARLEAAVAAL